MEAAALRASSSGTIRWPAFSPVDGVEPTKGRRLADKSHEVADGEIVRVEGSGWSYNYDTATAFIVSLRCDNGDIALSFDADSSSTKVTRNAFVSGAWGPTETGGSWPSSLASTKSLKLDFKRASSKWEVSFNDARQTSWDFANRATCKVVSATVTQNVNDARVMLISAEETLIMGMKTATFGAVVGIMVAIFLSACIFGCCVGRVTKKGAKKSNGNAEEMQALVPMTAPPPSGAAQIGASSHATEWFYQGVASTQGPYGNQQMLALFNQMTVHPGTKVKLVWHENFVSLSELYPKGREFIDPPRLPHADGEDLRAKLLGSDESTNPPGQASLTYEAKAEVDVKSLGIVPANNQPPGAVHVLRVDAGSWAQRSHLEPGHSIVKINGKSTDQMTLESFKQAMSLRPIQFVLEKPAPGLWGIRWYYKAGCNNDIGPIDTGTMRYYFLRQFVKANTQVRAGIGGAFLQVGQMFPDVNKAFTVDPAIPGMAMPAQTPAVAATHAVPVTATHAAPPHAAAANGNEAQQPESQAPVVEPNAQMLGAPAADAGAPPTPVLQRAATKSAARKGGLDKTKSAASSEASKTSIKPDKDGSSKDDNSHGSNKSGSIKTPHSSGHHHHHHHSPTTPNFDEDSVKKAAKRKAKAKPEAELQRAQTHHHPPKE